MKRCKACGTVYSNAAAGCPKCSGLMEPPEQDAMPEEEVQRRRKRDWIMILLGFPLFMLCIYGLVMLMHCL